MFCRQSHHGRLLANGADMWAQCRAAPSIPRTYPIRSLAKGWSSAKRDDAATPLPPEEEARRWSGGANENDNGIADPSH
jgi:hypothetical protein